MSDIKLTSKEYCESVFVDGPKFDKLSAFVSGPDAQVQSKLTAGTGINLNGSTISVNTATSVGTSNLPVTASAVNTKLSSYVNSVSSPDGSITVTKTGSSVTLKANGGGGGNYVPLGSYGIDQKLGALPIGGDSGAEGERSTATGYESTASGDLSSAYGSESSAYGDYSIALGHYSRANSSGVALGRNSDCFGTSSFAIGPFVTNRASGGGVLGNFVRNSDHNTIVIGTFDDKYDNAQFTQLYLIAAGSGLSTQYCNGEAGLGYITTEPGQNGDSSDSWPIRARGTRKLSDLLTDHTTDFTPDLSL